MIKSLSNVFTDSPMVRTEEGLAVNKPGIFNFPLNAGPEILKAFADLTSRLGVELAGMRTPLTGTEAEDAFSVKICSAEEEGRCSVELKDGGILICGRDSDALNSGIEYLVTAYPYTAEGKTLAEIAGDGRTIEYIEIDTASSQPCRIVLQSEDGTKETLRLSQKSDFAAGVRLSYDRAKKHFNENKDLCFLCDDNGAAEAESFLVLALRFALENYETVYPYGVSRTVPSLRNIVFSGKGGDAEMAVMPDGIEVCGKGENLTSFIYSFCAEEKLPLEMDLFGQLEDIFSVKNEIGQALTMLTEFPKGEGKKNLITREYAAAMVDREALQNYLSEKLGKTAVLNFNDSADLMGRSYTCVWEGTELKRMISEKVLPQIKEGDAVRISARLSEDIDVRRELESEISQMIAEKGADPKVEIFCSYKSGYSWIEEKVIPEILSAGKQAGAVRIGFPYLLNERGDDKFEDESTPNYGMHLDNPLKFFDIPTRWLQELFPVDELIAERLNVPREKVEFYRDDSQRETYVLTCLDENEEVFWQDSFDVKYVQKKYIEKYPQIGRTHVTTGWLTAEVNGDLLVDQRIESDPEKVWRILEKEIIPLLETYLVNRYGIDGLADAQPLFNRLQIDILMSEMDRDLGFRQERISVPEAMQEDIYFYLLDWFKTFGERECGRQLDNVGLIMPEPEIRKGRDTKITMTLYGDLAEDAEVQIDGQRYPLRQEEAFLQIEKISCESERITVSAAASHGKIVEKAAFLDEMIEDGILAFYGGKDVILHLHYGEQTQKLRIPAHKVKPAELTEGEKNELIQHCVVDYEQYLKLLGYYENKYDIKLIPAETTYKGRKIFAIDCRKRLPGVFYAENKMNSERISAVFTARHHGNESSSLNSTFLLLEKMMEATDGCREKINTIMVPFINIDGGMLHCRVQRRHPKWLCHPARYNSAGFEFRKDFDNPGSRYGEARMLKKLWERYLFDVITDNHGFEGHELCQPFSGYISPWYKSFWVPRALYYGYIWYKGDYDFMVKMGEEIRSRVAAYINDDEEIRNLNLDFADRFYKYAQKWFPDLFTLQKFEDVVFYWIDTNISPRAANFGMRNPEITAIDWTTEVADETAVGEYMGTNVRAHHISDLATLAVMQDCPLFWDTASAVIDGRRVFSKYRRHPLFAEENETV